MPTGKSSEQHSSAIPAHLSSGVSLRRKRVVTLVLVALVASVGISLAVPRLIAQPHSESIPSESVSASPSTVGQSRGQIFVHVVGAVSRPGLYVLSAGDRVLDAIMLAGGLASSADQCALNLARTVSDGEQIIVPLSVQGHSTCSAVADTHSSSGSSSVRAGKVSLSRATLQELDSLPGVGPALAGRIIDWRTAHGGFQAVEQLDEVSGIGGKLLASLQPLVVP